MNQYLPVSDPILLGQADSPIVQPPAGGAFGAVFQLSSLDGDNGFRLDGGFVDGSAGVSVSSAGDVNGDGFTDIIVGASRESPNGAYSGASYVVFGGADGFDASLQLADLTSVQGFKLEGAANSDHAGAGVAPAGDVNDDGVDDFIVGAVGVNNYGGSTYVVFGKAGGFASPVDLADINGKNGFRLDGGERDLTGESVASAGDFNGDGFADIIIGGAEHSGKGAGYIVFGHANDFHAATNLSDLKPSEGFRFDGDSVNGDNISWQVASAGDVNGDGLDDVILGATQGSVTGLNSGSSYVVFGKASGFGTSFDLAGLNGATGFRVDGAGEYDFSGQSVASAGDVNGDGFADLIIGAPGMSYSRAPGASYVIFGKASGFGATLDLSDVNGDNGFKLQGGVAGEYSGFSVASAGDFNGDGFDDLIIGAPGSFFQSTSSASYVVFGKASGFAASFDLTTLDGSNGFKIESAVNTEQVGWAVASAGDVNGDGLDDLIIGAPWADPNGNRSGSSYVIFGQLPTTSVNRVGTDAAQSLVGGDLKDKLSGMGGDDMLWGHGGKDKLTGGTGDDTLIGGAGKDVMAGGVGADVFAYRDRSDSTAKAPDTIKGLDKGDILDLSLIDADSHTTGDQAFHMVSSFTGQAGELTLAYDAGSRLTLLQGDVDGDGVADFVVHITGDHHDFTNFVL